MSSTCFRISVPSILYYLLSLWPFWGITNPQCLEWSSTRCRCLRCSLYPGFCISIPEGTTHHTVNGPGLCPGRELKSVLLRNNLSILSFLLPCLFLYNSNYTVICQNKQTFIEILPCTQHCMLRGRGTGMNRPAFALEVKEKRHKERQRSI